MFYFLKIPFLILSNDFLPTVFQLKFCMWSEIWLHADWLGQ
jgi:hypothetical protein